MLEFIDLKKGNISVKENSLKFTQLDNYAPTIVVNFRAQMSKFIYGVFKDAVMVCRMDMMVKKMNISRLMVHAQYIDNEKLKDNKKENKRAKTGCFSFSQHRSNSANHS